MKIRNSLDKKDEKTISRMILCIRVKINGWLLIIENKFK
jgi:hypothetical protein